MSQPLLSIGMIVKNEERCLEKCLKALEPIRQAIPCELVIADTGSTDKTKEIASRYANILFDFTWINDFAAARNAVMDKCSGTWFLSIDADEYFVGDPQEFIDLLTKKEYKKYKYARTVIRNFSDPDMKSTYSDFFAPRMVRFDTGCKFIGTIHEVLAIPPTNDVVTLDKAIFNHDGYTAISPEHFKNKCRRNLELLKIAYEKNPDDSRVISELLDASHPFKNERALYTKISIEHIKTLDNNSIQKKYYGAVIAKKILQFAIQDNLKETDEWIEFTYDNFSDSLFLKLDINYIIAGLALNRKNYDDIIKYGTLFLKELYEYNKLDKRHLPLELHFGSLSSTHNSHADTIRIILAEAYFQKNDVESAFKHLNSVDITTLSLDNFAKFITILENQYELADAKKLLCESVTKIIEVNRTGTGEELTLYNYLIARLKSTFAHNYKDIDICRMYSDVSGTIGISCKLLESETKEDAEELLNKIENWDEFLPLAFAKAISLKAILPEEFFDLPVESIKLLLKGIPANDKSFVQNLCVYIDTKKFKSFKHISFAYYLIAFLWLDNAKLHPDFNKTLSQSFYEISKLYLNNLYKQEVLENESIFSALPSTHRFSILFIRAIDCNNPKEKISLLRKALKEEPEMKKLINHILEDFQIEEEKKKQEQIKTASPELVAMAEQLKTMLKAFPPNSPELLSIKQSPMYKQVAFLIED